ncbi:MAG: thrombospondin, partial [Eubacteriales bacterium]|nr:thrombospondin [Eubacteriales bacterium]
MTDPTKKDSDNNGISDYYEDFDGDGLINGLEYINGTDPYKKDSDEDGLSDYDEIYIYKTNALKSDSDE